MDKPIPNACKTNQFEKCPHGIDICVICVKTKICKDYIPIYSWREISDYYTCPKCFDPCTYMGCPKCNPKDYNEALKDAINPISSEDKK